MSRIPGICLVIPRLTVNYFVTFRVKEIIWAVDWFQTVTTDARLFVLFADVPFMALHESLLMFAGKERLSDSLKP